MAFDLHPGRVHSAASAANIETGAATAQASRAFCRKPGRHAGMLPLSLVRLRACGRV